MKKIIKILLIIFIIISVVTPLMKFAIYGYDSLLAILSDIYPNLVVAVLSAALLGLYNSKVE